MSRGDATGAGELRHHCAVGDGALYIIGVWESEERVRTRWASAEFEDALTVNSGRIVIRLFRVNFDPPGFFVV
jgi:hypothetical protein